MGTLQTLGVSLCAAALICTVLLVLAPESSGTRLLQVGLAAFLLVALAAPLADGFRVRDLVDFQETASGAAAENAYAATLQNAVTAQVEQAYRQALGDILRREGVEQADFSFVYNTAADASISMEQVVIRLPAAYQAQEQALYTALGAETGCGIRLDFT